MTVPGLEQGRYVLGDLLGRGGMALVYRAEDVEHSRPVAVKVLADNLASDPEIRRRFLREAELAERLSHPNIVGVLDHGEVDGRPYIVFEFVDGPNLAEELGRTGPLPAARVQELGAGIAAGLAYAHACGLVHRDVKPHNLLLAGGDVVRISDFGIARVVDGTQLTQAGTVLGTAAYIAPEQAAGNAATPAADVYSLGVVFYEALTGRTPWRAATISELLLTRRESRPTLPSELAGGVPEPLESLVLRCLADDPTARPRATEVERTLRGELETPTRIVSRPAHRPTELLPPPRTRRWRAAVAAVAAVLLAGLGTALAVGLSGGDSGGKPAEPRRPAVAGVPTAPTPAGQARNLSRWLRSHSR